MAFLFLVLTFLNTNFEWGYLLLTIILTLYLALSQKYCILIVMHSNNAEALEITKIKNNIKNILIRHLFCIIHSSKHFT